MISRVIIDVESGKMTRLLSGPDFHRAMSEDNIDMGEYLWSPDGSKLGFVSTDRFHKNSTAKLADISNGEVRTLFTETEKTTCRRACSGRFSGMPTRSSGTRSARALPRCTSTI